MPQFSAPRLPTSAETTALVDHILEETGKGRLNLFLREKTGREIRVAFRKASIAVFEESVDSNEKILVILAR